MGVLNTKKLQSEGDRYAGGFLQSMFDNLLKNLFHLGMTDTDKEVADRNKQDQLDIMAESQRYKEDFFNKYESLPAQMAQAQQAGINPLTIFGNGASVSASSAPSAGSPTASAGRQEDFSSLLGTLLNFSLGQQRVENEKKNLEIQDRRVNAQTELWQSMTRLNVQREIAQSLDNSLFPLRRQGLELDNKQKETSIQQIGQWISESKTRETKNEAEARLLYAEADEVTQRKINESIQQVILEAQSKYSDSYYKAVAGIAEAESYIQTSTSQIMRETYEKRKASYIAQLNGMIIQTGKEAKIFQSEYFDKMCKGKMTSKEKTELWGGIASKVVSGALAGASVVGAASIRAASAAAGGLYVPTFGVPQYSSPNIVPPAL